MICYFGGKTLCRQSPHFKKRLFGSRGSPWLDANQNQNSRYVSNKTILLHVAAKDNFAHQRSVHTHKYRLKLSKYSCEGRYTSVDHIRPESE